MNKKGFTLLEMVVVLVILVLLILVLIPTIFGAVDKAKDFSYDMTVKRLREAATMFTIEYPNSEALWGQDDAGTPAYEVVEYSYQAWSYYMDEYPENPKNPDETFMVEIRKNGEIIIYTRPN